MINGYTLDYLKEMARLSVEAHVNNATSYGIYVAGHYDGVVRETSIPLINSALIDELERINNWKPGMYP